jgi:hypothetical protein
MSTKKTIQINPELFKMPGNKTRKNKEKKELTLNPVVSPSNLKNKLLKRIKEHKTNELKGSSLKKENNETFTDEFYGAMDYLSGLKHKQKQLQILNNKTLKNHTINNLSASSNATVNPQIFLDLPPELTEPNKTQLISNEIFNMNYKTNDGVPYGCLKNGKKKTYREWKEESSSSAYPELPDLVRPPTPPKKTDGMYFTNIKNAIETNQPEKTNNISLSREERLEQIKNKLRKMEDQETAIKRKAIEDFNTMEKTIEAKLLPELDYTDKETNNIDELIKEREKKIETMNPKQYLKKTVKRKFTLGKSDKLRRISVLIKDRQTRKNIINTQKELKKTDITDVRRYLRQHGIIKVGTTCPADILRKTFESALLAGEVTNTNKETLLHNFLSAN